MDELIFVEDGAKAILEYVNNNFRLLLPLQVSQGWFFQIRISKKQYEGLSEEIKHKLRFWAEHPIDTYHQMKEVVELKGSKEEKLYLEENYWTPCDAYIFNYNSKNSFVLEARCKYGYDGLEESYDIVFAEETDFPPIIFKNHDSSEGKENFDASFDTEIKE